MAVAAHAEPDQIRRPVQVGKPRIGGAAGQLVIGGIAVQWQNARTFRQEYLGEHRDIGKRIANRNEAIISGDDRDTFPTQRRFSELFQYGTRRVSAGKGNQRLSAGIERAFNDEGDIADNTVDKLLDRIKFPPLDFFGHPSVLCLSRQRSRGAGHSLNRCDIRRSFSNKPATANT